MLVYIHVPFCKSRCNYCAFYSQGLAKKSHAARAQEIQKFLDSLFLEIAFYGDKYGKKPVESVFFGGGTPGILPFDVIDAIMNRLHASFSIAKNAEITLETNPESLRHGNALPDYLKAGINRLSIGIQSLDDETLRILGRPHKAQDSLHAVFAARNAGFNNINVDMMWGLPGQSIRQWLQSVKDIIRLEPDHISPYGLTLEPGTQLEKDCENGKFALPPERDQALMYMEGAALLESSGFLQYEISNFSKMGFQCRHNLGYWEGKNYLGIGPSATSTIGGRRWTNPASMAIWSKLAEKGEFERSLEILSPRTRLLEMVMLRLRTARGLRLKAYKDLTGHDFVRDHNKVIQTMHENGLARIRNGYFSLTRSGMLVSNAIISNLFERINESLESDSGAKTHIKQLQINADNTSKPIAWPKKENKDRQEQN